MSKFFWSLRIICSFDNLQCPFHFISFHQYIHTVPVSYTHLDVYKRQTPYSVATNTRIRKTTLKIIFFLFPMLPLSEQSAHLSRQRFHNSSIYKITSGMSADKPGKLCREHTADHIDQHMLAQRQCWYNCLLYTSVGIGNNCLRCFLINLSGFDGSCPVCYFL